MVKLSRGLNENEIITEQLYKPLVYIHGTVTTEQNWVFLLFEVNICL